MKRFGYTMLWYVLRVFVYAKRFLVWFVKKLWMGTERLNDRYQRTIGFHIYKIGFVLKKRVFRYMLPFDGRMVDLFGRRGTLQVVLFFVIVVIMIPHSKLYTKDTNTIPGRQTVLYQLVGPGGQDFDLEEIGVDVQSLPLSTQGELWKQGSVSAETLVLGNETRVEPQDFTSITAGGSALVKPTILPGATLPTVSPDGTSLSGRREIVVYEVQPGDVIGAIAEQYGISVNTILWANSLSMRSYILPKDQLKILPVSGVIHKVVRADTVNKIARVYNADPNDIIAFNRLEKDGADIVIGEELIVPDGEKSTPLPTYVVRSSNSSFNQVTAPPPSIIAPAGSGFIWPTSVRHITQYFGWRHTGTDIAGPVGTPLYASKSGTVIRAQNGWNGGYGNYIIIDHGGGVHTLYGHAQQLFVSPGDGVVQGQTIATMGSTGNSTGSHIHFEVRVNNARQNPLKYVR